MRKLLLLLVLLLVGCTQQASQTELPAAVQPQASEPTVAPPSSQTVNIQIVRYQFSPDTITVKKGDTVRWVNQDGAAHSIKFQGSPASPIMSIGQQYEMPMTAMGTYQYSCGIHPKMLGTIIVE